MSSTHRVLSRLPIAVVILAGFAAVLPGFAPRPAAASGAGVLVANGSGYVHAGGQLTPFHATVAGGSGTLVFKDNGGDAKLLLNTAIHHTKYLGLDVYFGVTYVQITGSNVAVTLTGNKINLNVTGTGWAALRGTGAYSLNGGASKSWSTNGTLLSLSQ